jgi:hypothetical protein
MSSSNSSQWRPRLLIRHALRCSGVALNKRGNHASGTPKVRPSDSPIHMLSSSKYMLVALTKELAPGFLDKVTVYLDQIQ